MHGSFQALEITATPLRGGGAPLGLTFFGTCQNEGCPLHRDEKLNMNATDEFGGYQKLNVGMAYVVCDGCQKEIGRENFKIFAYQSELKLEGREMIEGHGGAITHKEYEKTCHAWKGLEIKELHGSFQGLEITAKPFN